MSKDKGKGKGNMPAQIPHDNTIILSTENVQKKKRIATLAKISWRVPSLNSCHRPKFWWNQKISVPIRWKIAWRLFLAWNFFKKVIFSLSYRWQKVIVPNCFVFSLICHFFKLSLFLLPVWTFLGHFLSNPLKDIKHFCNLIGAKVFKHDVSKLVGIW